MTASRIGRGARTRSIVALASLLTCVLAAPDARSGEPVPIGVLYAGVNGDHLGALAAPATVPETPREPCHEDCYLLSSLVVRGSVSSSMAFELKGGVRAREITKVPLFGPPSQVRLDDVTIDGAPAAITFDADRYYILTSARSFEIHGRVSLGTDQMIAVAGPIVAVDARLTSGKLVEGDRLSGVIGAVLHFDPMTDGTESKPKAKPLFRLARALRFAREPAFSYKLTASDAGDLGAIRLPLRYGEKVGDVQGSAGWSVEGSDLLLPTSGHEAEITITGTLPSTSVGTPTTFTPDARSAYEWWLVEADPEHQFSTGGEAKLVETSQSPIPASFPGARVYLVQRGQGLEVEARSLVRGDVLAALARSHRRHVAITGRGELISDETIRYDNNGLDHVMVTPAGKPMYVSTDTSAQRILHTEAGAKDIVVPVRSGTHLLRVQSLAEARLWPLAGVVAIPSTTYPLATSTAEITIGLPEGVHPIAVLGGDRTRWALARADLIAAALGIALACFGFRTHKTRAIASVCTAGLWFVSREAFVVVAAGLFLAGGVFLATRFVRGAWLLVAASALTITALLGGRFVLASDATAEPTREMFVERPELPRPEVSGGSTPTFSGDPRTDITPVSLSFPTSERYVQASRQLVSSERPFVPRVFYITGALVAALYAAWLGLVGVLVWAHRERLVALKAKVKGRLAHRPALSPDPATAIEAPPF